MVGGSEAFLVMEPEPASSAEGREFIGPRAESLVDEGLLAILESRSPGLLRMLLGRWREGEEWTAGLEARGKLRRTSVLPASAVEAMLVRSR